jgi:hypothetical protein
VRPVQLHAVEARALGALGRRDEVLDGLLDLGGRHGARAAFLVVRGAQRRGADQRRRRTHARVVQLHGRQAARRAQGGRQAGETLEVRV